MLRVGNTAALVILVALFLSVPMSAKSRGPSGPPPILTIEEFRSRVDNFNDRHLREYVEHLGVDHFELLLEATGSRQASVRRSAYLALGRIGTDDSLRILRDVVRDSTASDEVQLVLDGLVAARDRDSIGLLVKRLDRGWDELNRHHAIQQAIGQIQSPTAEESLVFVNGPFLGFRFFLDEIESMEFRQPGWLEDHRVVEIPKQDFRAVCEMLQAADRLVLVGAFEYRDLLIIRLHAGRELKVVVGNGAFRVDTDSRRGAYFANTVLSDYLDGLIEEAERNEWFDE